MGLGDILVVISLAGLALLAVWPHYRGRIEARNEAQAAAQLLQLADELSQAGLAEQVRAALTRSQEIKEIELRCSYGPEHGPGQQLWEDAHWRYLLDLEGEAPGLRVLNKGEKQPPLRISPGAPVENAPEAARRLLSLLAADFWEAMRSSQQRIERLNQQSKLGYRLRLGFMPRSVEDPADCELELYAWPDRHGEAGHAVFRWCPSRGLQQTRNLVRQYQGEHGPTAMSGAFRPGSSYNEAMAYTGLDGNQWLPVFRPIDLEAYRSFAAALKLLKDSEFHKSFEKLSHRRGSSPAAKTADSAPRLADLLGSDEAAVKRWAEGLQGEALDAGELAAVQAAGRELLSKLGLEAERLTRSQEGRSLRLMTRPPRAEKKAAAAMALELRAWPEAGLSWQGHSHLIFGTSPEGKPCILPRKLGPREKPEPCSPDLIWVPLPRQLQIHY
ncbi:MAG: hypothetical protein CSA62_12310 [Planctomycetota bacterium]|nr:MAG: hypothetical protein CSA62_12310 [Planctomycetota bacterium]